jgi:N-sulfoglucosamine sulfohydrolase
MTHIRNLALTSIVALSFSAVAQDKPNVVLVIADDMRWSDMGCYGNKDIHTPNIDKLAKEGMRFTRCFTATAMCAPTRQQLYTGMFPIRNGAYPNHSKVYKGVKSLPHHLKELGYRVAISGKKHFGPPAAFPFKNLGDPLSVKKSEAFVKDASDKPFCLVVTSHNPHSPYTEGDASRYDPKKLTLPKNFIDTPENRISLSKYYAEITELDRETGEFMEMIERLGKTENTIFMFTTEQGSSFPFGKWTCYESGLHTGLVVRWPGKVKPGSTTDAMVQYVDFVPTLIEAAGGESTKVKTGRPDADGKAGFDGKSFLSVLLGKESKHHDYVYGIHTSYGVNNASAYPIRSIRGERYKLVWNPIPNGLFSNSVANNYRKRYFDGTKAKEEGTNQELAKHYLFHPEFELYDVTKDEFELEDQSGNPEFASIKQELTTTLKAWCVQQGDADPIKSEEDAIKRQGKHRWKKTKETRAKVERQFNFRGKK